MNSQLIKLIFFIACGYITVGSLLVVITSYISALGGGQFFGRQNSRWSEGGIPAAVLFWIWPIIIPITTVYFLSKGWMKAVEYLSDKAIESGQMREKKLRGIATK